MRRFLLGVFVVVGVSLGATPTLAQRDMVTDCDVKIIDKTASRVLDVDQVNAAIIRLERVGADVRVRAFEKAPGSLDAYQADHVRDCASWQGSGGVTKGNLVTLLFSLDRKSAIFYGGEFRDDLSAVVDDIRDQTMGDQLRAGNFTGAIVASLDAVNEEVTPYEWGSFWKVFGIIIGVLLGVFCLVLLVGRGLDLRDQRRVRRERLQQTRQRVAKLHREAKGLYLSIDEVRAQLAEVFLVALSVVSAEDNTSLNRDLSAFTDRRLGLKRRWDSISLDGGLGVIRTQDEADKCEATWTNLLGLTREIDQDVRALLDRCHALKAEADSAPQELEMNRQLLSELIKLQASSVLAGFKPVVDFSSLEAEQERIETAGQMIARRRYGGAMTILRDARGRYTGATATIHELSERRAKLLARLTRALENAELFPDQLADASEALSHARATYGQSNWEGLQGLFNHLKDKTGRWHTTRVAAEHALSMQVQDWDKAAELVAELEEATKEVARECAYLIGQVTSLDVLAASAQQMLTDVTADIRSKTSTVQGYEGDQSPAMRDISVLGDHDLVHLRVLLEQESPCYVDFKRYHEQLVASLKRISTDARSRHDRVVSDERRRQEEEEAAARRAQQHAADATAAAAVAHTPYDSGCSSSSTPDGSSGSW